MKLIFGKIGRDGVISKLFLERSWHFWSKVEADGALFLVLEHVDDFAWVIDLHIANILKHFHEDHNR